MARKGDDFTNGEKKVADSLAQGEEHNRSEFETSRFPAIHESDSSGEGSLSDNSALEALREAYGNLTDKLHSPLLLEHLLSSKLLTEVEYDTAKSKESSYEKNTEVLSALRRRTQKEIVQFCQLLFTCNQSNCGRILLAALSNHGVDISCIAQPSPKPPAVRSSSPKYYLEMRDLKKKFITLVREVIGFGRQVDDLKHICIELLNDVTSAKRNVQEDINELKKCSDGDCIAHLQPYWDPLDCDLLHQLICQLQKPELMTDWEKYKLEVKDACKATLAEAKKSLPQWREQPVHQILVGFQTDQLSRDATIQKILDLRDFLKKMMGLEEADFEGFDNVDVTIFYTVNRIRLPFLVRLFALHRRSLQEFSITVVFVREEFIYNVTTDQEFTYPKLVSQPQAEVSYQLKDLKEEILHQFEQLKSSKISEEEAKTQHLQNEAISLRLKLKEEEMLRKKLEDDRERLTGELKMQTEKKKLVAEKKELLAEKQEQVDEKNPLTIKNKELAENVLKFGSMASKKEAVMSSVLPEEMMSEVRTVLEQESSSLEGLQDKLKILLEDWSKQIVDKEMDLQVNYEEMEKHSKEKDERIEIFMSNPLKKEIERLKMECFQLSLKNDGLHAKVTTRDKEIQRLSLAKDNCSALLEKVKDKEQELLEKVKDKEQECKDFKQLLQEATGVKQGLAVQLTELITDHNGLKQQLKLAHLALDENRLEKERCLSQMRGQIESLEMQLDHAHVDKRNLQSHLDEAVTKQRDTIKVNRCYYSASIRDLMVPYLLSLPFSHEFSHESNTGTSAPMMVLLDLCDLPALKVVSIGSLSPKQTNYLHPIHAECTSTVNSIISEVCKCYETEPYQVCSITFVKCADRVYLCQLLIAIIPNIITKNATLEADILYSLARVPLTSQLKSKVKSLQETLYKPKWYSRSSNSWLSGFKFEELPKMLHPISEQLELQTIRELKKSVKTIVEHLA